MGLLAERIAVSTNKCSWLRCEADWTTAVCLQTGVLQVLAVVDGYS